MLNLKLFWILPLLTMFLVSGCSAEAGVIESTATDGNSTVLEEVVLPTAIATESVTSTSSPIPAVTVTDTAVATTTSDTPTTPTQQPTPVHTTPIPPKTTPLHAGDNLDKFLVRSLNTETNIPFEDLAVDRSQQHLSQQLQIPIEEITLVSINRAELDNNNICQSSTKAGGGIEDHGTTLGYEILLNANNQTYRYMISHNLGYYCAN